MKDRQKKERQKCKKYDELIDLLKKENITRFLQEQDIDLDYFFSEI